MPPICTSKSLKDKCRCVRSELSISTWVGAIGCLCVWGIQNSGAKSGWAEESPLFSSPPRSFWKSIRWKASQSSYQRAGSGTSRTTWRGSLKSGGNEAGWNSMSSLEFGATYRASDNELRFSSFYQVIYCGGLSWQLPLPGRETTEDSSSMHVSKAVTATLLPYLCSSVFFCRPLWNLNFPSERQQEQLLSAVRDQECRQSAHI